MQDFVVAPFLSPQKKKIVKIGGAAGAAGAAGLLYLIMIL